MSVGEPKHTARTKIIFVVSVMICVLLVIWIVVNNCGINATENHQHSISQHLSHQSTNQNKSNQNIQVATKTSCDEQLQLQQSTPSSNTNQSVYDTLFPTNNLKKTFDFVRDYLPLDDINDLMDVNAMYERSLSIYPGNNGPLFKLLFNKLVLDQKCLLIAFSGGSITHGWHKDFKLTSRQMKQANHIKSFPQYLKTWLDEMFPCNNSDISEHVIEIMPGAPISIDGYLSNKFYLEFVNNFDRQYDIIFLDAATNSQIVYGSDVKDIFASWELYYASFLNLDYHPVVINLALTIKDNQDPSIKKHNLGSGNWIPGQFTQIPILEYYQIPSISMYDAFLILMNEHQYLQSVKNNPENYHKDIVSLIKNNEYVARSYMIHDNVHPIYYGHQLIASFISYYFMKEYTKVLNKWNEILLIKFNKNEMNTWINKHYLLMDKPLITSNKAKLIQKNKIFFLNYQFGDSFVNNVNIQKNSNLSGMQIVSLFNDNILNNCNVENIKFIGLYSLNIDDDWRNETKYGNKWHFGFEKHQIKRGGLIFITSNMNHKDDNRLHKYNYRVVTFKLDLSKVSNNENDLVLQIVHMKSYQNFGNAILWIDNDYDINLLAKNSNFYCKKKYLQQYYRNIFELKSKWTIQISQLETTSIPLDSKNRVSIQYLHICVVNGKFKIDSITLTQFV